MASGRTRKTASVTGLRPAAIRSSAVSPRKKTTRVQEERYRALIEQSLARWHFKTLNALLIEKDYREAIAYGWHLIANPGIPRTTLLRNSWWAAQGRFHLS